MRCEAWPISLGEKHRRVGSQLGLPGDGPGSPAPAFPSAPAGWAPGAMCHSLLPSRVGRGGEGLPFHSSPGSWLHARLEHGGGWVLAEVEGSAWRRLVSGGGAHKPGVCSMWLISREGVFRIRIA